MVEFTIYDLRFSRMVSADRGKDCARRKSRQLLRHRNFATIKRFIAPAPPDAVDDRDSTGSMPLRWCLDKEISAWTIRRGHRKTAHWLDLDAVTVCCQIFLNIFINPLRSTLSPAALR